MDAERSTPGARGPHSNAEQWNLAVPPELVEHVADLVAARVAELLPDRPEPYLDVEAAAEFLACKPPRIYDLVERGAVPVHRDGRRLLFRASELSAYFDREES